MKTSEIITLVISVVALFVSIANSLIAWRGSRRAIKKEEPLVTADVSRVSGQPGWFYIGISMTSRTNHGYQCLELRLVGPKDSLGITDDEARGEQGRVRETFPLDQARRVIPMSLSVAKAGEKGGETRLQRMISRKETGYERFYLFSESAQKTPSPTFDFSVLALSDEAEQRRITVKVKRTLSEERKIAGK